MKVLYFITKSNWGGAQRHVFDLAVEAQKEGYEVVVALGGEGILKQKFDTAGIRTISLGTLGRDVSVSKDTSALKDIWNIIRTEKPDILHLHSPKAAGLGAFSGYCLRVKKIIYTAHGWAWNENRPFHQKAGIVFISWITMLFCTKIITLSQKETNQAVKFPFVSQKIRLIPLGITPPIFYGQKNALAFMEKHLDVKLEKRPVIGTISELHPNKGLTYLIEAVRQIKKKVPNLAVIIVGEGELRHKLETMIKDYELTKTVYLAGYIDGASQYLRAFNIFTLTSLKEGLPYTIFEAAYANVPVIATAVGGIPELVEDMKSGILIQPKKANEIAAALEFMVNHKNVEREHAHALHERIEKHFSISKMFEKNFALYSESNTVTKSV